MTRIIAIASVALLSACSTYPAPDYGASIENVAYIERLGATGSVRVGEFSSAPGVPSSITCRAAGPITASTGVTYAEYVRGALHDELYLARVLDPDSDVEITGRLDAIDFVSTSPARWEIAVTISAPGRPSISVDVEHAFNTSWSAEAGCRDAANALESAVERVISELTRHPDFRSYLSG